jgi:hypothetical protein
MFKTIQISDEYFWGFKEEVNINNFSSFEELAIYMKKELIIFLRANNLLNLVDKAEKLKLHNHNFLDYKDIHESKDDIIYLCGGCGN